ncbi:hypothetical protein [Haloglycomyces albus]|nr:hypothetical protein [Haloglycomyces albus]
MDFILGQPLIIGGGAAAFPVVDRFSFRLWADDRTFSQDSPTC